MPGQGSDFAQEESAAEEGVKQREGEKNVTLKVEVTIDEGFAQGEFEGWGEHSPQCAGVVEDQAKGRAGGRRQFGAIPQLHDEGTGWGEKPAQ
jgi:hypothetical protein